MKNKMATLLGTRVFFRNKKTMSQCNSQSAEPVTIENLVIHFDQETFEKLLSRGSLALHARKPRRVSVAKTPPAADQKAIPIEVVSKPRPATCASKQRLLQFLSVSTKAKLTSCEAKQVPCEPKTAQGKQVWKAKQGASLREVLDEVEALCYRILHY